MKPMVAVAQKRGRGRPKIDPGGGRYVGIILAPCEHVEIESVQHAESRSSFSETARVLLREALDARKRHPRQRVAS